MLAPHIEPIRLEVLRLSDTVFCGSECHSLWFVLELFTIAVSMPAGSFTTACSIHILTGVGTDPRLLAILSFGHGSHSLRSRSMPSRSSHKEWHAPFVCLAPSIRGVLDLLLGAAYSIHVLLALNRVLLCAVDLTVVALGIRNAFGLASARSILWRPGLFALTIWPRYSTRATPCSYFCRPF